MSDVEVGGIYRVVAMDRDTRSALVLVTDVDEATQSATVTLLTPDFEFGTSTDLTLSSEELGRAYALLAESDIFGYVWCVQLDRRITSVSADVLDALAALRADDAVDRPAAGPPVSGRNDPRWDFKLQELQRLQALSSACTSELIDGESVMSIDARALRPPSTASEVAAFEEFVVAVIDAVKLHTMRVPGWLLDIALDDDLVEGYRKVGLYNSLRLLWKVADMTDLPAVRLPRRASAEDIQLSQVESVAASGHSTLRLVARSTDVQRAVEARAARTADGRLVQLTVSAAGALIYPTQEVYA